MHVGDLDPARPGLEKFGVHEEMGRNGHIGSALMDARTGEVLWKKPAENDTGRGLSADIDPRHWGAEFWGSNSPDLFDTAGKAIGPHPRQTNFAIWWDGDLLRELLDGTTISKWDWETGKSRRPCWRRQDWPRTTAPKPPRPCRPTLSVTGARK